MKEVKMLIPVLILIIAGSVASAGIERVSYRLFDDFETGETFAWEPYPYQQDIGYDPAFYCLGEPTYKNSRYSIGRIVKPNDAVDLSQGFTKRIDMWTSTDTRMQLAFFLISDRRPEKVDVMFGTFDGRLYVHTVKSPAVNRWVEVNVPLNAFEHNGQPLTSGEHMQVVAIKAFYPVVSPVMSYTILMDDFLLTGERERQFIGHSPKTTFLEHFNHAIINKHFAPGEAFSVSIAPEGMIRLKEVVCDLITPLGKTHIRRIRLYDNGTNGDVTASDGVWSNNSIYTFKPTDPSGQWTARFTGISDEGQFTWDIRFIVPVTRLTKESHPRVFFTAEELSSRMNGPEPEGAKRLLKNIMDNYRPSTVDVASLPEPFVLRTEALTGGPYRQPPGGNWWGTQRTLTGVISNETIRYALTGDVQAGMRGVEALLRLCSLEAWNHPWMDARKNHYYYPAAPAAFYAGLGYDLLYPLLTEDQRAAVRRGIMENGIKKFYRDMVEINRMPSSVSNHISVILSGIGVAAVAIANDDPDLPDLEPYFSGILAKSKQYIDRTVLSEGSYAEPYTYQSMGLREFVEALFAFEKNFGVDYTSTTYLKDFYIYPLYVTLSRGRYQDLGDVSPTYSFTQQPAQWLVYKMKDPFMYRYVKPAWDSGSARGGILSYLWYTEGITPIDRNTLPTSKHFVDKGHMVMRSNWEDSGSILIFKAGPNSNHYHLDQGTILLTHNGEELLSDAGHSSSYYANLYYPGYYTQTIGHNCMLVDMNAESQSIADYGIGIKALSNYPTITHSFAGEIADAVEGDLACVYKDKLSDYTRTILYMKNGPFFLFDKVKAPEPHSYNWLFHAEHTEGRSSINYQDNRMTITRPRARLTMDVLSPEIESSRIRNSDRDESFLTLSSEEVNDAVFLAVMIPDARPSEGEYPSRAQAVRIDSKGWIGASLREENTDYYAYFKLEENAPVTVGDFTTDASRFMAAVEGGKLAKAYFEGSSIQGFGGQMSFSTPVTVAVDFSSGGAEIELDTPVSCNMRVTGISRPSQVIVNGAQSKNWRFDARTATLLVNIPEGRNNISLK